MIVNGPWGFPKITDTYIYNTYPQYRGEGKICDCDFKKNTQNLNPVCWLVWLSYPTTAPLKLRSFVRTEQMHACRFLRPLLPNRADKVSNKESTIRLQCLLHICAQYTTQRTKLRSGINPTTRKDVQLPKQPSQWCHQSTASSDVMHPQHTGSSNGWPNSSRKHISSNGRRLTSKSALADFEVGEVRRFRVSRRWNRCNDPHDSSGASSSVPQSRRSHPPLKRWSSHSAGLFIQHQFRLRRVKTSFAVRIRKPKWYPAFFICSATR